VPSSPPARPARPGLREAGAAFRHRNFLVFWIGALLSNTGTWMQNITVPFVVYELTNSAGWVGFAAFMQLMPTVLVGPLAGAVADRFPRRRVLMVTQTFQAGVAVALWAVWAAGVATPAVLVALVALNGLIAGLNIPSWQAFVSDLVPRSALLNAVTLNSAQFNASRALGPALGGIVLGTLGPGAAFLVNAGSYAAVLLALAMVRLPAARSRSGQLHVWSQFREGVAYTRRSPGIMACVGLVSLLGFLGMPVFQLAPVFARDVYHVGGGLYGLLAASMGIGAVLGAPIVGAWAPTRRRSRVATGALLLYAAAVTSFGLSPVYWLGFVSLLLVGAAHLTVASVLNTTIQLLVDESMRGRVLSIYLMVLTGTIPLGALIQGQLAEAWGAPAVATTAGALMLTGAVVARLRTRVIDTMDAGGASDADTDAARPAPATGSAVDLAGAPTAAR
jgi:MFS family permease